MTERQSGFGKQNYYWNEYRTDGQQIFKYRCHKYKHFDGDENTWLENEELTESWLIADQTMPSWLRPYL